jgi:hypothetical protein
MRMQSTEGQKIFANQISDNCLISRTYFLKIPPKRKITQFENGRIS